MIDRALVARRVADWRGILRRGPVLARQILRKVFPSVRPLALTPAEGGAVAFTVIPRVALDLCVMAAPSTTQAGRHNLAPEPEAA